MAQPPRTPSDARLGPPDGDFARYVQEIADDMQRGHAQATPSAAPGAAGMPRDSRAEAARLAARCTSNEGAAVIARMARIASGMAVVFGLFAIAHVVLGQGAAFWILPAILAFIVGDRLRLWSTRLRSGFPSSQPRP